MSLRIKFGFGILVSLLAHTLIFFFISVERPVHRNSIAVEILDAQTIPATQPPQQRLIKKSSSTTPGKNIRKLAGAQKTWSKEQLSDLLNPNFAPRVGDEAIDGNNTISDFSASQNFMFDSKTYDEANAVHGFLAALYTEINGFLIFDSILAQYNHFGTVFVQFRVSPKGRLFEDSIRVKSNDKILQVHVLRTALIPGLSQDLKQNLWIQNDTTLVAKFEFKHVADSLSIEGIVGKSLTFIRTTVERRVSRTIGKQLVNGGLGYDLFAVYDTWKKFEEARLREKLDVDPFSIYRADKYFKY